MSVIAYEPRRFRSTADYYARYRVPYPQDLIARVAGRAGLEPGMRVLDLGSGPGVLALGFAALGAKVTAMDPEPEMLAAAAEAAQAAGLAIELRAGSSYDLHASLGRFRLVTMGRSFHWMDRAATLTALDALIEPGGAIALFGDRRVFAEPDWHSIIDRLAATFSPARTSERRTQRGAGWVPHEGMLLRSAFSYLERIGRVIGRDLSADDVVGRALSRSVTSPEALGAGREPFERALRAELQLLSPGGSFREVVGVEALLALRPAEAGG